jgi:hypothetical protein
MSQSFIKKPMFGPHSALTGLGVLSSEQADQQPAMKNRLTHRESIGDQHAGVVGMAYSTDPELLRQCAASGQMEASEVVESGLAQPTGDDSGFDLYCARVAGGHLAVLVDELRAENAALKAQQKSAEHRRNYRDLAELSTLAWRALCDAEAVLNTLDGECVLETINLRELQARIGACASNLFTHLGLAVCERMLDHQKVRATPVPSGDGGVIEGTNRTTGGTIGQP